MTGVDCKELLSAHMIAAKLENGIKLSQISVPFRRKRHIMIICRHVLKIVRFENETLPGTLKGLTRARPFWFQSEVADFRQIKFLNVFEHVHY